MGLEPRQVASPAHASRQGVAPWCRKYLSPANCGSSTCESVALASLADRPLIGPLIGRFPWRAWLGTLQGWSRCRRRPMLVADWGPVKPSAGSIIKRQSVGRARVARPSRCVVSIGRLGYTLGAFFVVVSPRCTQSDVGTEPTRPAFQPPETPVGGQRYEGTKPFHFSSVAESCEKAALILLCQKAYQPSRSPLVHGRRGWR